MNLEITTKKYIDSCKKDISVIDQQIEALQNQKQDLLNKSEQFTDVLSKIEEALKPVKLRVFDIGLNKTNQWFPLTCIPLDGFEKIKSNGFSVGGVNINRDQLNKKAILLKGEILKNLPGYDCLVDPISLEYKDDTDKMSSVLISFCLK